MHVFGDYLVHRQVVVQQREPTQPQFALRRLYRHRVATGLDTFSSFGHALAPLVLGNRVVHSGLTRSEHLRVEFPCRAKRRVCG